MIEKTILDYLNSAELPARAYTEMPKTPPTTLYLIEKTGDSQTNRVNTATVAIQSYGGSLYEASSLNEELKDAMMNGLIRLDGISGVKLNSDYNYTDTTTKRYRYQAVFLVTYY
jgi:hypothetical protein